MPSLWLHHEGGRYVQCYGVPEDINTICMNQHVLPGLSTRTRHFQLNRVELNCSLSKTLSRVDKFEFAVLFNFVYMLTPNIFVNTEAKPIILVKGLFDDDYHVFPLTFTSHKALCSKVTLSFTSDVLRGPNVIIKLLLLQTHVLLMFFSFFHLKELMWCHTRPGIGTTSFLVSF